MFQEQLRCIIYHNDVLKDMVVLEALTHHISEFLEDYFFGRNT